MESIASVTLASPATITFSSIPSTYASLRVVLLGTMSSTPNTFPYITFNSNTSSYGHILLGTDPQSGMYAAGNNLTGGALGYNGATGTVIANIIIDVFNYTSNSSYKSYNSVMSEDANSSTNSGRVSRATGTWASSAVVTSITLSIAGGNLPAGTLASLYGIKAG